MKISNGYYWISFIVKIVVLPVLMMIGGEYVSRQPHGIASGLTAIFEMILITYLIWSFTLILEMFFTKNKKIIITNIIMIIIPASLACFWILQRNS